MENEKEKNETVLVETPPAPETQTAENAPVEMATTENVPVETPTENAAPVAEEETAKEGGTQAIWAKISLIGSRVLMVLSLIIVLFTCISTFTFNKDDKKLFGVKMYVVLTDSMKATDFAAGDLIFVQDYDFDKLKEGDIITFVSQNKGDMYLKTITHKILRVETDERTGKKQCITYGTTSGEEDKAPVTEEWYRGKYVGSVPKVGTLFNFFKTKTGYVLFILLPFGLLIAYQAWNCIKAFRSYRDEQTAEYRSEKESLAKEREANEKLLEEMRMLRAQMAAQAAPPTEQSPPPTEQAPATTDEK